MEINYTLHATRRLIERQIATVWVESALAAPDRVTADPGNSGVFRAYKRIPEAGGRVIRVVYSTDKDSIRVITVFLDRDAR